MIVSQNQRSFFVQYTILERHLNLATKGQVTTRFELNVALSLVCAGVHKCRSWRGGYLPHNLVAPQKYFGNGKKLVILFDFLVKKRFRKIKVFTLWRLWFIQSYKRPKHGKIANLCHSPTLHVDQPTPLLAQTHVRCYIANTINKRQAPNALLDQRIYQAYLQFSQQLLLLKINHWMLA